MRVGYLVSQYPAASHTFILREVEALRARGVDIETFSIRRPGADELTSPRSRHAGDTTYYVLPPRPLPMAAAHLAAMFTRPVAYLRLLRLALRHRAPGVRALLWAMFHFLEAVILAGELKRRRIDHLHNHFANAGATVGFLASRFLGLPWSLTLHGISETDYPAGLLLGEKIRAAKFVACVSHFGRAQAMRLVASDQWSKLVIVRCGLNLASMPQATAAPPAEGGEQTIVCVGRLSAEKGHPGLLAAFARLRAGGVNAQLVLVGDGPERSWIETRAEELGVRNAILFKGRLSEEDTLTEIARSDMLVLPSLMEGLPIVLMEAMAIGVPVVSSRVAGVPELVQDGVQGLLFHPSDWNDLAGKMECALKDPEARRNMMTAARRKIEEAFAIERAIEPLIELFGANRAGGGAA